MTRRKNDSQWSRNFLFWFGVLILLPVVALLFHMLTPFKEFSMLKDGYFPSVVYHGPKEPPEVVFQKAKPASWVKLSQISKHALGAVIVSEDWAFYSHSGVDLKQLQDAIETDIREKRFVRGASTITQQVAKNLFLNRSKSLLRKIEELILAFQLEREFGKKRILEYYFNIAEWGPGVFGIQKAAGYYFKKSASELTAKDGAFLAMLLPSPIRYGQSYRQKNLTPFAQERIETIMSHMVEAGYLSENERVEEISRVLPFDLKTSIGAQSEE